MTDRLSIFREMLGGSTNRVEKPPVKGDSGNVIGRFGGGGGQNFGPSFGGGGMDPWQVGVEKRLDSLDRRASNIEADVGTVKVDLATLKVTVDHLPRKEFILKTVLGSAAVLAALQTVFKFVG